VRLGALVVGHDAGMTGGSGRQLDTQLPALGQPTEGRRHCLRAIGYDEQSVLPGRDEFAGSAALGCDNGYGRGEPLED